MEISDIVGTLAAVCMVFGYLPQAVYTIRTRDTDGIAMPTFILMFLGSVFFMVQGILISNIPLFVTNLITGSCSAIIFIMKIYNTVKKRRRRG